MYTTLDTLIVYHRSYVPNWMHGVWVLTYVLTARARLCTLTLLQCLFAYTSNERDKGLKVANVSTRQFVVFRAEPNWNLDGLR
jgi:hypothetical protein